MAQHHTLGELYDALQELHAAESLRTAANNHRRADAKNAELTAAFQTARIHKDELRALQVNVYHPCTDVG